MMNMRAKTITYSMTLAGIPLRRGVDGSGVLKPGFHIVVSVVSVVSVVRKKLIGQI